MRLVDITPQSLERLEDSELKALWNKLSMVWEIEKPDKDEVINRAIFIMNELTRRKLEFSQSLLYKAAMDFKKEHQKESWFTEKLEDLEEAVRQPFGSPGGKRYMADRLVRMFPEHSTYVEVFVGGGACFWKKKPSMKEVINDKDRDIIMAYKTIQNLTERKWEELKRMNWQATKAGFAKAKKDIETSTGLRRFHDFIYLKQFSDVAEMKSYDDRDDQKYWAGINNLWRLKERLEGVTILNEDYGTIISMYNNPDTFFYIDPPYPSAALNWKWMPEETGIEAVVSSIKGKFLMSYELTKKFSKFTKSTIQLWAIAYPGQHHKGMTKTEQLICNYKIERNTKYLKESDIESGYDWFSIFHELFVANGYANNWLKLKEETKLRRITEAFNSFDMEVQNEPQADEILGEIRSRGFETFLKSFEIKMREQTDPYLRYPDEKGSYKCVFQHHYRGKSVHCDQRSENIGSVAIGWTINDQIPREITEAVTTVEQAKNIDKKDIFKINYKNGEWKKRKDSPVNISIVTEKKSPMPRKWLMAEGVIPPGEVGATKNFPGVITILQKGIVEYGTQKSLSHEYFYNAGPIDYRVVYRKVTLRDREDLNTNLIKSVIANYLFDEDLDDKIQEAINDPNKMVGEIDLTKDCEIQAADKIETDPDVGQVGWLAIKPVDQIPYAISSSAVKKSWMPPLGYSALPKVICSKVPEALQYWKSKNKQEAIDKRNMLVEQMKKGEIKLKEQKQPTTLQSIVFSKEKFKSRDSAIAWLKRNNKKFGIDETENTWRARQRDPNDFKPGRYVTHEVADGVQFVLGKLKASFEESRHRRYECMECSKPPTFEVKWAEGMAHAWFCDEHFKTWSAEHKGDIDYIKKVQNGIAAMKFADNTNPNIKEQIDEFPFALQHQWVKGKDVVEHWDIRIDTGKPDLLHMVLEHNPISADNISFYLKATKEKETIKCGKSIERIDEKAWIDMIDSGNVTVLERTDNLIKLHFHGKKLSGPWIAKKESPSSEFWQLNKTS